MLQHCTQAESRQRQPHVECITIIKAWCSKSMSDYMARFFFPGRDADTTTPKAGEMPPWPQWPPVYPVAKLDLGGFPNCRPNLSREVPPLWQLSVSCLTLANLSDSFRPQPSLRAKSIPLNSISVSSGLSLNLFILIQIVPTRWESDVGT